MAMDNYVHDFIRSTHISEESRRAKETAPQDPYRAVYFDVGVILSGFQVRSLETISASGRKGRGLDGSFERLWIFVWIRAYQV